MQYLSSFRSSLLSIFLTLSLTSYGQIPTSSLVGYWPLNGNTNDLSGNGFNGTVTGATLVSDRFGNPNSAYAFTGSSQYIQTSYAGIAGSNDRTFSLWFNQTTSNSGVDIWSLFTYGGGGTGYSFEGDIFPANISASSNRLGAAIAASYVTYNPVPTLNTWHHLVLAYSSTFGISVSAVKVYLDNVLLTSVATTDAPNTQVNTQLNGQNLVFGGLPTYTPNQFLGYLDDIRVYSRALNTTEVNNLFNEGVCTQSVSVTDTLRITTGVLTSFNPLTYSNSIKVYPNPTKDHITIDFGNYSTLNGYTLRITNSLGSQVYSTSVIQQQSYVSLANWGGNGLYFVYVIDGSGNTLDVKKIVLQ